MASYADIVDAGNSTYQRLSLGNSSGVIEHRVFRWRKALASSDHLTGSRVSRYLNFAEQRRESYNGIISEVKDRISVRVKLQSKNLGKAFIRG